MLKTIKNTLEQGQNRLRYALELKEKVVLNTEQTGATKIVDDIESLKGEFDKLMGDVQDLRQKLTVRATQLEEVNKVFVLLADWLNDVEQNIKRDQGEGPFNDVSEKKSAYDKFKFLYADILQHSEAV